jgi:hypothetical protein
MGRHARQPRIARHIRQPVASAADIGQAFDSITYLKGAAVITMFENFIGAGTFRKGVQDYCESTLGGTRLLPISCRRCPQRPEKTSARRSPLSWIAPVCPCFRLG